MSVINKKQDISLAELMTAILKGKVTIFVGTVFFAILSVAIALYLPNQYKSKATLIINSENNGSLSSLAGGLGGLAGMAGINLNSGKDNNPLIAKELVKSQAFILLFIEKHSILVPLMAATHWDAENDVLVIDKSKYDVQKKTWLLRDNPSQADRPKQESIVKAFKDIVQLSEDTKTGIITLSVEFYSPALAKKWLSLLINEVNETIRQYDIEQATKSIAYLNDLLKDTQNNSFKGVFYNLIEEHSKKLMLSKVRDDYVFKEIDPPNLPEKKSKPLRAVICLLGTFFGGFLMTIWVLFRYFIRQ